jgi:hypothetical protein
MAGKNRKRAVRIAGKARVALFDSIEALLDRVDELERELVELMKKGVG